MTKRYLNVLTTGDIKDTHTGKLIRGSRIGDELNAINDENEQLKEELDYWKKRALLLEKKYDEGDSVKWLRESKDAKTHLRPKRWKV